MSSVLETGGSEGWRLATLVERTLAADVPLFGVSLVLNQPQFGGPLRGYPYEPDAAERIAARRREFEAFVEAHNDAHLYGITTRHHYGARTVLSPAEREEYNRRLTPTPASFGPPMPDRLLRGIILARLATLID